MTPSTKAFRAIFSLSLILSSALLCRASRAAHNWIKVRSAHFTVVTNANEKEGRKIASQFELFRATFHSAFPTLRVDQGPPIIILAAKNQNTMKEFLPEEYQTRGHIHHAGMYQGGVDRHYVILSLDAEGDNPYHTLYHEYTHALLHLNFTNLPLWFDEGMAEYLGNATIGDKDVRIGKIPEYHLQVLQSNRLIPVDTLLTVGQDSPYYNENNQASVFYAESWALVHYMMMDPDARKQQLLPHFLQAWTNSGDALTAAHQTFGDLKRFEQVIERYARQQSFYVGVLKPPLDSADKMDEVKPVSEAEVLAYRADFYVHHNRTEAAAPLLAQALQMEPNSPFIHECQGIYEYRHGDLAAAEKEMREAIRLGADDFSAFYYEGMLIARQGITTDADKQEAADALNKSIQLNPEFAPAYSALAAADQFSPDKQTQAINAAVQAVKLDPTTLYYAVQLTYLLMNNNRVPEARTMASRITAAARTPQDKEMAESLQLRLNERQQWEKSQQAAIGLSTSSGSIQVSPAVSPNQPTASAPAPARPMSLEGHVLDVEGEIGSVTCSKYPEVQLEITLPYGPAAFHAADITKAPFASAPNSPPADQHGCGAWKGRRVKLWFQFTPGKEYTGEITRIYFF